MTRSTDRFRIRASRAVAGSDSAAGITSPAEQGGTTARVVGAAALLLVTACTGGTEQIRNPDTGVETVRMKNNRIETPGSYRLAFNLAVVREARERGFAVYLTYHGEEPIQVPYASGIEVRVDDRTWKLRGMVQRRISGIVGCTMGVACSYVTHIMAPLDRRIVEAILSSDRFTVLVNARTGRYRGTGGGEAIRRMRAFVDGLEDPPGSLP